MSTTLTAPKPNAGLSKKLADKYSLEVDKFLATVKQVCFTDKTNLPEAELISFLIACNEYDLNPLLREIYAFPKKGGGFQTIVGVDGWVKIANRHPAFNGMEFIDATTQDGQLLAVKCRIFRKDREYPIEAVEYMTECKRSTDPWRQMPARMLRNRALCQAVRMSFGVCGAMNQDEFERWQEVQSACEPQVPRLRTVQQPAKSIGELANRITYAQQPQEPIEPVELTPENSEEVNPAETPNSSPNKYNAMFDHCKTTLSVEQTDRDIIGEDPGLSVDVDYQAAKQAAMVRVGGAK